MDQFLKTLWSISKLIDEDLRSICDIILSEIIKITNSPYGFYGFLNESEEVMTIFSWSQGAMADCNINDKLIDYPISESGIWGNAVRTKKPFLLNDYHKDCDNKRGTPSGHVPLTRVLSVPVVNSNKVVAVGAVANKKEDYTKDDINKLSIFLDNIQTLVDRKKLENALEKKTTHFRDLYRKTPAMMHSIDRNETIINVSNQWLENMGYERREVLGRKFTSFLTDESAAYAQKVVLPIFFKKGKIKNIPYNFITKDGSVMETLLSASAEHDDDGNFVRSLAVVTDVTEKNKLMQEQTRSAQLAALGTVAAGVAHEINNPINGIINYAVLLGKYVDDKNKVLDIASRITRESNRIAKITADLLNYSKDSHDEQDLSDIVALINSALSLIAPKIRSQGIKVTAALNDNIPKLFLNPQSIQQVIINLIDNSYDALRYKQDQEDEPTIHISCSLVEEPHLCHIEVSDNGIGMSENVIQKSKDAFFTTKPANEGTGLGLSIVNDIINKHNGSLIIKSKEGEFTRVSVLLPINEHRTSNHGIKQNPEIQLPLQTSSTTTKNF